MKDHGPWKILSSQEVFRDPWLAVFRDEVIRPDGTSGAYCYAEVKPGAAVLPLDDEGFVYLVEEFRYAIGVHTLEVVGGGGEPGEDPLATGRRELKEELGIEADEWTDLGRADPFTSLVASPGRMFLARGLHFGDHERESSEQIRPVKLSLDDAVRAVLDNRITHATSCALILKAHLWLQRGGG